MIALRGDFAGTISAGADKSRITHFLCSPLRKTPLSGSVVDSAKEVIHDYPKIGDFTLFQGDAEMYFKAKYEKLEFHNWHDIRVNVYV